MTSGFLKLSVLRGLPGALEATNKKKLFEKFLNVSDLPKKLNVLTDMTLYVLLLRGGQGRI